METLQEFLTRYHCRLAAGQDPSMAEEMWQELPKELDEEAESRLLTVFLDSGLAVKSDSVQDAKEQDLRGMDFIQYRLEHGDDLPDHIRDWAEQNLAIVNDTTVGESEVRHARNALERLLRVNWNAKNFHPIDIWEAKLTLNRELFGLESVKQRILETIIQVNRTKTVPAYGILLTGPAGVGKSQLANITAKLLGMPWYSLDMSMIANVEALTGTPRLYMNARPGAIMQAITTAGSPSVMFLLNELDKSHYMAEGGDPSMALLSLLDHLGFTDNYYECTIPTDDIYTVATANDVDKISSSVRSRFSVIELEDYTPDEKFVICRDFVIPKVMEKLRMHPEECSFSDSVIARIVEKHQHQTGCRELEQEAEHLLSRALYILETTDTDSVEFTADDVE